MNNPVEALALDNLGNLYAGGRFTSAGGVSANCIAKWDGSNWFASWERCFLRTLWHREIPFCFGPRGRTAWGMSTWVAILPRPEL